MGCGQGKHVSYKQIKTKARVSDQSHISHPLTITDKLSSNVFNNDQKTGQKAQKNEVTSPLNEPS
jgi:hypothetical protein